MEPIAYQISEEDYLSFWKLNFNEGFRNTVLMFTAYLLLAGCVYFFLLENALVLAALFASAFIIIIACGQRIHTLPRLMRETYREDVGIKERVLLTFDDDKFTRSFTSGSLTSRWSDMVKWHENEDVFAVFPNRQLGIIFPKTMVDSETIELIRKYLIHNGLPTQNRLRK